MRYITLGCLALFLVAATAHAEWLEASSDHFVIYSDQNEEATRGFAERLERFHAAMAHVFGKQQTKPGPSNRVTIFVVSSRARSAKSSAPRTDTSSASTFPVPAVRSR